MLEKLLNDQVKKTKEIFIDVEEAKNASEAKDKKMLIEPKHKEGSQTG